MGHFCNKDVFRTCNVHRIEMCAIQVTLIWSILCIPDIYKDWEEHINPLLCAVSHWYDNDKKKIKRCGFVAHDSHGK